MAVRSTMNALIGRMRILVNDPSGSSQNFTDQTIQDVMDESREDIKNLALVPKVTFSGSTMQYLDYYSRLTNWEDDYVIKQYLTVDITSSVTTAEPISAHWYFSTTKLPPIYISGKTYDIYRAAADLLERLAAQYMLRFDFTTDGQSFRASQMHDKILDMALHYRMKQRARSISMNRSDLNVAQADNLLSLEPHSIDFIASGDGR